MPKHKNFDKLFDFVDAMFTDPKGYSECPNNIKDKHFFMVQRFMAIYWPTRANFFNRKGIAQSQVVDVWQRICSRAGKVPSWIYTKVPKNQKGAKTPLPSNEIIQEWVAEKELDRKDFEHLLKHHREDLIAELKDLEAQKNVI